MIIEFSGAYEFLNNSYPSPFQAEGTNYPSVEHYFQAMKTCHGRWRKQIAEAPTPEIAKKMGDRVPLRPDWGEVQTSIMEDGLRLKFHDKILRKKLLNTGTEVLINGNNHHDNTWGDCQCKFCLRRNGENKLGLLLMALREEYSHQ